MRENGYIPRHGHYRHLAVYRIAGSIASNATAATAANNPNAANNAANCRVNACVDRRAGQPIDNHAANAATQPDANIVDALDATAGIAVNACVDPTNIVDATPPGIVDATSHAP